MKIEFDYIAVLGDVDFRGSFNLERVHSGWSKIMATWSSLAGWWHSCTRRLIQSQKFQNRVVISDPTFTADRLIPSFYSTLFYQLFLQLYPHSFITTTHLLSVSRLSKGAPLVLRHVGSSFFSTFTSATKAARPGPLGGWLPCWISTHNYPLGLSLFNSKSCCLCAGCLSACSYARTFALIYLKFCPAPLPNAYIHRSQWSCPCGSPKRSTKRCCNVIHRLLSYLCASQRFMYFKWASWGCQETRDKGDRVLEGFHRASWARNVTRRTWLWRGSVWGTIRRSCWPIWYGMFE